MWTPALNVGSGSTADPAGEFGIVGKRFYELSNHLGNVLATVSDKRIQTGSGTPVTYLPDVINAQDYYGFGMIQPTRQFTVTNASKYRYGFNGKENDNDVKLDASNNEIAGGEQDYGMRIYDPRVGKFLSLDPLQKQFPFYSPFQYSGNSPIVAVDLDGLEPVLVHDLSNLSSRPKLGPTEWYSTLSGVTKVTDIATFNKAAKNILQFNKPNIYTSVEERHGWYSWASGIVKSKGNYWFEAATDVTSGTMVGGSEAPAYWWRIFMNSDTRDMLRNANAFLIEENFKNFGKYVLGTGPVTWKGRSYDNLKGADLDNQMVVIEMTTLQGFLNDYKDKFIAKYGARKWDAMADNVQHLFSSPLLNWLTPEANRHAQKEFKKTHPNEEFNFMNLQHRIFQGQKMAEYLRMQAEKKKKKE